TNIKSKAAFTIAGDGDGAHVVHIDQAAAFGLATGKRKLEFPPKPLSIGMAEHELRGCPGIGNDIEHFRSADTGNRAGRDISDGVATGLARCDPHSGQPPHQGGGVVDVYKVKLKVLACGDM